MVIQFSEEALFILNVLYKRRNLSPHRGFHSEKLRDLYNKRFPEKRYLPYKDAIKNLKNAGYITVIKKAEDKFYISNINGAIKALRSHGYISDDGLL
ncbi:hypothetical protein FTO68_02015 [Methanocalculus taiwanensis]|uniref:Uncharacterized protein n=1 Tax=Methanocalculus taiwanensis TaxID=106207 RepID=A0ABD4TFL7_9EURY|nr:hypothetical protein [Methanocalculus taiwanensis]MCQ1537769.1 hypothetical protein [Methanocalculus taiwanensis]